MGRKLKILRVMRGLTQAALARKLGITQGAVSQWEVGNSFPSFPVLRKLADVLGVAVDDLIEKGA